MTGLLLPRIGRFQTRVLLVLPGLVAALGMVGLTGCGSEQTGTASYRQTVLQERLQKELDLRSRGSRVLSAEAKTRFEGLRHFPVDSTYRFAISLERLPEPDTMRVAQRTGAPSEQLKVGTVEVPLPGGPHSLSVFRPQRGADTTLWIPFADETTGRETYGAGRYLDARLREDGTILVDFNRAYNPLCDYNPQKYNCALAPPENRLPVSVEAGEKKSLLHEGAAGRRASS
jgi:uncharacterized protein (DUF1684 family)